MQLALRRKYYNLCNPDQALPPDDERNVDIDNDEPEARGLNWVSKLATKIELSNEPVCEFFTGLRGSGKSTELHRLAARLSSDEGANLLPVFVDGEDLLDLTQTIDVPDILVAILHRSEEEVLKLEGADPAKALAEGPFARLWRWATTTDVELKSVDVEADAHVAKVKASLELKTNPSLRAKVRKKVAENVTTFIAEVDEELRALDARAKQKGREGLVVIFDSLEKLRGLSTNWSEVLTSAERVFASGAPFLRLPVHAVFTFPPALVLRLGETVQFMPMIKLVTREGKPCPAGLAAARQLIERRLPKEIQNELFGPVSGAARIDKLVQWSGGYPREIVRLLQTFIQEQKLDDQLFARILGLAGDVYRNTVPVDAYDWLAQVHETKDLAIRDDAQHRELVDRMLQNNVVLRYQNDTRWYDVHPAVLEIPGVKSAVDARRAKSKT